MSDEIAAMTHACPRCGAGLTEVVSMAFRRGDYHTRIDEPFNTGRCDSCSRTYRRLQSVGLWKPETFAPVCRMCRNRELTVDVAASTADRQVFTCRLHPRQKWAHDAGDDRWTEYSPR